MKKLLFWGLISAGVWLWFYPFSPGSQLYAIQSGLKSVGKSEADYRQQLVEKQQELQNYEEAIHSITAQIESIAANAPICPKTGQKIEVQMTMTDDPRPELRRKCDVLVAEIEAIERKLRK